MSTHTKSYSAETKPRPKVPKQAKSTDNEPYSYSAETQTETVSESETKSSKDSCPRNWLSLPRDVTSSILLRLGAVQIIESAQKVCTQWHEICKDPSMWRSIDMSNYGDLHFMPYSLVQICMHAIDRSCGGLVDINIGYFGTDELLAYIPQRTSNLRCLRLIQCRDISDEGLSEAASKFPLLEELEIYSGNICKDSIEAVGRCCPLLKTFKYNQLGLEPSSYRSKSNGEAVAIASYMHGLRHLQLIGNLLTNEGLQAILDGCPDLETLDLRKCVHVNLKGDIGERCAKQIKMLRRPNDSILDYPFIAEIDSDYDYGSPSGFDYYSYGFGFGCDCDCDYDDFVVDDDDVVVVDDEEKDEEEEEEEDDDDDDDDVVGDGDGDGDDDYNGGGGGGGGYGGFDDDDDYGGFYE